ncbi:hypothetical protein [Ancylobacter rudongensis]|uniref:Uncharacterized protein n=1 Tax=Ancylobacter rudongensis TaxID=177413 RepID=A0A1G4UDQ9_9HYPH|nr:hypothetical protein [Ancylobacter rudongensis]SCW91761.1 hypothetical protein SAMN05660859_3737 [Ancylobacter rudongensis]
MKVVIEFYRTRAQDSAHAVVGRETVEVNDLDGAIEMARALASALDMPQQPDAVSIVDSEGRVLLSSAFDSFQCLDEGSTP